MEIGCQPYWVIDDLQIDFPTCSNASQLKIFIEKMAQVAMMNEGKLQETFKCFKPCIYMEYKVGLTQIFFGRYFVHILFSKVVEEPVSYYDETTSSTNIYLKFASPKVTIKREVESYSVPSLVADYGGFLGLSVGFNFLMIWECLTAIFFNLRKRKVFK